MPRQCTIVAAAVVLLVLASAVAEAKTLLFCQGRLVLPEGSKLSLGETRKTPPVEARIVTDKGTVKEKTGLSPNGFFAIPVEYFRGAAIELKVPDHWKLDRHRVTINDEICLPAGAKKPTKDKEILFTVVAVTFQGKVTQGACGDEGAEVAGAAITYGDFKAVSSATGDFTFKSVPVTVDPMMIVTAVKSSDVKVGDAFPGVLGLPQAAVVSLATQHVSYPGWELKLEEEVQVVIVRAERTTVLAAVATDGSEAPAMEFQLLQEGKVQHTLPVPADGVAALPAVKCGTYSLVVSGNPQVTPAAMPITAMLSTAAQHYVVARAFSLVSSTRLIGNVAGARPIPAAQVELVDTAANNVIAKATTDESGMYRVDNVPKGSYAVRATKGNLRFSPVTVDVTGKQKEVSAPMALLSGVPVCYGVDNSATKVSAMVDGQAVDTTKDGELTCFFARPGASVTVKVVESSKTVIPDSYTRTIGDDPVKDLLFTSIVLAITVRVDAAAQGIKSLPLVLEGPTSRTEEWKGSDVTFTGLSPGTYHARLGSSRFCSDAKASAVELTPKRNETTTVTVSGFQLPLEASVAGLTVAVEGQGTEVRTSELPVCVAKPGVYQVTPKSHATCKVTGSKVTVDTEATKPVLVRAQDYTVWGEITCSPTDKKCLGSLSAKSVVVTARGGSAVKVSELAKGRLMYAVDAQKGAGVHLDFQAKDSAEFALAPASHSAKASGECTEPLNPVVVEAPVRVTGKTTPPTAGVHVVFRESNTNTVVAEADTDAKGAFSAGPLLTSAKYTVKASTRGAVVSFEAGVDNDGVLTGFELSMAVRVLSSLLVKVTEKDTGATLPGAFVAISGDSSFSHSGFTESDGTLEVLDIPEGVYHVRPSLSEYRFDPDSLEVAVKAKAGAKASSSVAEFKGIRTGFSVFGRVVGIDGVGVPDVVVEGVQSNGEQEHAETGTDGTFRLRGFAPKSSVTIRHKNDAASPIDRLYPEVAKVTLKDTDVRDVEFVSFPQSKKSALRGVVQCPDDLVDGLEVRLYTHAGALIHTASIGLTRYYEFSVASGQSYVVKLQQSKAFPSSLRLDSAVGPTTARVTVQPNQRSAVAETLVAASRPRHDGEEAGSSLLSAAVSVMAIAGMYIARDHIVKVVEGFFFMSNAKPQQQVRYR